jgi:hypothetical protein
VASKIPELPPAQRVSIRVHIDLGFSPSRSAITGAAFIWVEVLPPSEVATRRPSTSFGFNAGISLKQIDKVGLSFTEVRYSSSDNTCVTFIQNRPSVSLFLFTPGEFTIHNYYRSYSLGKAKVELPVGNNNQAQGMLDKIKKFA